MFWVTFSFRRIIYKSLHSSKVYNNITLQTNQQKQNDNLTQPSISSQQIIYTLRLIIKMSAQIDYTKKTGKQVTKYLLLLKNCSLNCLGKAEKLLEKVQVQLLLKEYEASCQTPEKLIQFHEFFFGFVLDKLDFQFQKHDWDKEYREQDLLNVDYQQLQAAIQRSEADIRKHIKIQQEMKLHMDLMEQEIDTLTKKLMMQQNRYGLLFQTMKQLENQRKTLEKMVKSNEISKKHSHNLSHQEGIQSIVKGTAPGWIYKATKPHIFGNKLRNSQQDNQNMKEEDVDNDLDQIRIKKTIGKMDHIYNRHHLSGNNYLISIKKLVKTQQMKEKSGEMKRRVNPKQKSQISLQKNRKLQRSTSVCS